MGVSVPISICLCGAAGGLSLCGPSDKSLLSASESRMRGGMLVWQIWQRRALSSGSRGGQGYGLDRGAMLNR